LIQNVEIYIIYPFNSGGGQAGRRPGENGVVGIREAGLEGAGSGIPKVAGKKKHAIFRNQKLQRGGNRD